ncbi:hypothetical protein ILUMI_23095 [Ignelater luminosus]|uniref:AGC-kinase C-terminal domain-containing protein n=1 Tax=Ignelater luminosus TaxID=2038154 RepID=A0A8K0CD38_IGNLU|nr:hypothetical protein ILUMI_23095 [Ignelater luminosus]
MSGKLASCQSEISSYSIDFMSELVNIQELQYSVECQDVTVTEEQDYLEESYDDDTQDYQEFHKLHLQDGLRKRTRNEGGKINLSETEVSNCSKLLESIYISSSPCIEPKDGLINSESKEDKTNKNNSKSDKYNNAESGWEIISDTEISTLECKYNNIDDPWILVNPSYAEQINWGTLNEEIEMPPVVPIYEVALGDEEDVMKFCCLGCMKMENLTKF